jgi:hypothetical protein
MSLEIWTPGPRSTDAIGRGIKQLQAQRPVRRKALTENTLAADPELQLNN